ncbi:MAG: TRAP transporter substrate-binding protein DctP [Arenicella sp.]
MKKLFFFYQMTFISTILLFSTTAYSKTILKIQTAGTDKSFNYIYMKDVWVPKLEEMTKGEIVIKLLPAKSVIETSNTPDAISTGILDGDLTAIAYFSSRNAGFDIMGDLIAGYNHPTELQSFCKDGGGEQVLQKLWDKALPNKIQVIGCGAYTREALVSKVPIKGVADLKGVSIRSPEGMAANVFKAAGANPMVISFADIPQSLDAGIISAADASSYSNNDGNGMHKNAKYPIYPGIHSMATEQFTVSKKLWDSLSAENQKILKNWFYDAYADMSKKIEAKDKELVARDKSQGEITVVDWSVGERDKFRKIAEVVWQDTAKKSPEAQAALDANISYMKKIGLL